MAYKSHTKNSLIVVLESFHDSDLGPDHVDFDHTVTLFKDRKSARSFINKRKRTVRMSPLAATNEIEECEGDLIVFASDDWYKWEIFKVEVPE